MKKVLIAEGAGAWRDSLEKSLRTESVELELTREGERALAFLTRAGSDAGILIIGSELKSPSAPDAIFRAYEAGRPAPTAILLVTDIRADAELLALLRKRGVTDFLYRDVPLQDNLHRILHAIHGDSRIEARLPVRLPATVSIGTTSFDALVTNLSSRGAELTFTTRLTTGFPSIGDRTEIRVENESASFAVSGVIRRAARSRGWFRERRTLGVQFVEVTEKTAASIQATIEVHRALSTAINSVAAASSQRPFG